MDNARFKRREIKTGRQPTINNTEGFVTKPQRVGSSHPDFAVSDQPLAVSIRPGAPKITGNNSEFVQPKRKRASPAAVPAPPQILPTIEYAETVAPPEPIIRYDAEQPDEPIEPRQARRPLIDMELPGEMSPARKLLLQVRGRSRGVRRWAFRITAFAMIAIIAVGGILFSQGFLKLHKVLKGGTASVAALKANVDPQLLKGEGDGRVNILLMGRGGGTHEAPDLTDTMMLASIDPVNHTSTLLSLPRDLWVDVPNDGAMKINAAYETGEFKYLGKIAPGSTNQQAIQAGLDLADQTVESVLGVTINYNIMVNFQAFQQAVDTVGGVTIDVPADLVDPTMAWENGNNPVLAKAGTQIFDGKHALIYTRSRETSSDFARAERQRAVLLALKQKVETLGTLSNPLKLSGLLSAFGDNVNTDLSIGDATRLLSIAKQIDNSAVSSTSLDETGDSQVTTADMNGQSIVEPKAGLFDYTAIQAYVRSKLQDGYILKENAKIAVLNGTNLAGLATTKAADLKSYGYNVISTGNAPTSGYTQTTLVDLNGGKDKYTQHYLEQRYNVTATTALPDNTIAPNGADFVIIIGSDETSSSQN